ncbi:MAG: RNA-directed DNA polymerase [Candidatus Brocadiales bacterium]|nr:RNA-directed DNA polymerase [Candidatus Bathyanammoxibius sp.]
MSLVVIGSDFHSPEELVEFLGLDYSEIQHILQTLSYQYRPLLIPKAEDEWRKLLAPKRELKHTQRVVLDMLLDDVPFPDSIHGYRKGRSILTNAEPHIQQELVINIDIENFFPSVHPERVKRNFLMLGYRDPVAKFLVRLCTFNHQLPQGAPTSPALANLAISRTMLALEKFCKKRGINFTGYSDDLTFSGPQAIEKHIETLMSIIRENGFRVNKNEIKIQPSSQLQEVTGLVVNDKVNLNKSLKKKVRAMLHTARTNGPESLHRDNKPYRKDQLLGLILHTKNVDQKLGEKHLKEFYEIDWE